MIDKRMRRAAQEAEGIDEYDYIVFNDDLDLCVAQLHEIVKAANNTTDRNREFIENIRTELEGEK